MNNQENCDHNSVINYIKNDIGTIKFEYCSRCNKIINNFGYIDKYE